MSLLSCLLLSQLFVAMRVFAQAGRANPTESPPVALQQDSVIAEANADPSTQAQRLRSRALAALEQRRFQEARTLFSGAFAMTQEPELLYQVGVAADATGDTTRAMEAFEEYLHVVPTGELRAEVEVTLAGIRARSIDAANHPLLNIDEARPASAQPATIELAARGNAEVDSPVSEKWWFWALIGGGVALLAGGVAVGVIASQEQAAPSRNSDRVSGVGVIFALTDF